MTRLSRVIFIRMPVRLNLVFIINDFFFIMCSELTRCSFYELIMRRDDESLPAVYKNVTRGAHYGPTDHTGATTFDVDK